MSVEERILLLAPRGRDAAVIEDLLSKQGQSTLTCAHLRALADALVEGAATAVMTEESLVGADLHLVNRWLDAQEAWSDFPFILLATRRAGRRPRDAMLALEKLGNVVVLERPVNSETLASAVKAALRVRRRQYEARERLAALEFAEEKLRQLNSTLETRIAERTEELSRANNRLMQEVAERERAQAALVQSQKMEAIGQLTGGIAHDFNNLLTIVSGNLELIARQTENARIARYTGFATQAADRAAKLTHQLLAFSRTQQLALAPVSLNELVKRMSDLLERTIGPVIEQQRRLDDREPWVMADAQQLELAVLNLAINARDAMPDGGVLCVETGFRTDPPANLVAGHYGTLCVSDNGQGIPASQLHKVFDPFFTTKPLGKGTGLGLSQVFGIAKQSGGVAQIESDIGKGTKVIIWLPLVSAMQDAHPAEDAAPSSLAGTRPRVMVVDDDDGVRRFIVESLELLGCEVVDSASGAEAVTQIERNAPDILIVDFAMPEMTGVALAEAALRIVPALPIVMITGYAEGEALRPNNVIKHLLRKPFHIDELARLLQGIIQTGTLPNRNSICGMTQND